MCFSAEVSFAAAGLLVPAGVACIRRAIRAERPEFLPLAVVPLGFGVQQFLEGLVWVGLGRELPGLVHWAAMAYLFTAIAFWPAWLTFMVASIEPKTSRRRTWLWCVASLGPLWFVFIFLPNVTFDAGGTNVEIVGHSLRYTSFERLHPVVRYLYLLTCAVPAVLSTQRWFIWPVAISGSIAFLVTEVVRRATFVSTWCFLSAVVSVQLVFAFRRLESSARSEAAAHTSRVEGSSAESASLPDDRSSRRSLNS